MKIEKILISEIKKINGNLLGIGNFSDNILNSIENNKNILFCDILSNINSSSTEGNKGSNTIVPIDCLYKRYKKKHINYIVCDFKDIRDCFPVFLKDIFKIYDSKLYLIMSKRDNVRLDKKFNKLDIEFIKKEDKDTCLYILSSTKINFIKNYIMYLENKIEIFGNIMSGILNK